MMIGLWRQYDKWILALIMFVVFFSLYASNVPQGVTGLADSDEVIAVSILGGAVHPSGYGLWAGMLQIATNIVPHQVFVTANRLTALTMALVVGILFLTMVSFLSAQKKPVDRRMVLVAATLAVLFWGTHELFFLWGSVTEVVQLALLVISGCYWLSIYLLKKESPYSHELLAWGLLWCLVFLVIFYHQISLLLVPGTVIVLRDGLKITKGRGKKLGVLILSFLISGLVTIGTTVLRNPTSVWSWELIRNPAGLARYLLRQDFSGFNVEAQANLVAYLKPTNLMMMGTNLARYIEAYELSTWGWLSLPILILGLIGLITSTRNLVTKFALINGLGGILIFLYLFIPSPTEGFLYYQSLIINSRFYLLAILPLTLIWAQGLFTLLQLVIERFYKVSWLKKWAMWGVVMMFLLLVGFRGYRQFEMMRQIKNPWLQKWASNVLAEAGDNTLICFSDISCFGLLATKHLAMEEVVTKIVPITPQIKQKELDESQLTSSNYGFNPERIGDLIFTQLGQGKRVYATEIDGYYIGNLGMESQILHLLPRGQLQEIACNLDESTSQESFGVEQELLIGEGTRISKPVRLWQEMMARNHEVNATIYGRMGKKQLAAKEIEIGLELSDRHGGLSSLAQQLPYYAGDPSYQVTNVCREAKYWKSLSDMCLKEEEEECAQRYLFWATLMEPANISLRADYARLLDRRQQEVLATIEWQQVLKLDPTNSEAIIGLE
jgi:hypothetical protein